MRWFNLGYVWKGWERRMEDGLVLQGLGEKDRRWFKEKGWERRIENGSRRRVGREG